MRTIKLKLKVVIFVYIVFTNKNKSYPFQVLREHNFDSSVLKRRSVPDEDPRARTAAQVALWTNHRVMEWLRTVDLSEYAPNLRGSGMAEQHRGVSLISIYNFIKENFIVSIYC